MLGIVTTDHLVWFQIEVQGPTYVNVEPNNETSSLVRPALPTSSL